jgi:hypothetical protein
VRPGRFAIAACIRSHALTVSRIAIIISARAFMFAACARAGSIASHTLSNRCFLIFIGLPSLRPDALSVLLS